MDLPIATPLASITNGAPMKLRCRSINSATLPVMFGMILLFLSLPSCAAAKCTEPSLRQAVHGRFLIGTAVMSQQLDDPGVAELIATQFNCITAENEFKPAPTEPRPGSFDFIAADRIVAF